jgi:hypothetical protein
MRGAGKSNAAVVVAETMFDEGIPWVAIDPKGDWYGIRSSSTGKKPGLSIPVFGGIHGDIPLHADGGVLLADLIIDERLTCVVDVSEFTKGEQTRFLVDMADRLFRRQRRSPEPMHLFLEEAHEYLPQRVMRDQAVLVGLWSRIVKQGRAFGLGCTVISQRSASLNKDVLTQIGTLIVMRTLSPQDRKAIKDWVDEYDVDSTMLKSLPELEDGEAWVWSPQFLKVFKRVKFHQRRTFDSGATPKLGKIRAPKTLAHIDIKAIEAKWAESIERAKEEDPRELRRRIAELEHKLIQSNGKVERVEVEVSIPTPYVPEIIVSRVKEAEDILGQLRFFIAKLPTKVEEKKVVREVSSIRKDEVSPVRPSGRSATPPDDLSLGKAERSVLSILAQFPKGRTFNQLALLTGYSPRASTVKVAVSKLRRMGYVANGQPIKPTDEGLTAIEGHYEPLPQGGALLDYWRNELGKAERSILDILVKRYPDGTDIDAVARITGYSPDASTIKVAMSKLRRLELAS